MVYGFAKQSGGHVEFETTPGSGTTFTLYIPATEQMPLPIQRSTSAIPGGHETILCIEDDAAVREFVVQQLQRLGYRTITATNATEALAEVRRGVPIDLVFTDIIMPGGMDGWKLAELIRQMRPDMKVLYTSGYSDVSPERMRSAPDALLLKKPYRFSALAQMMRRALGDSTAG
jgi:CheY-like chemotaxis protein